MAMFTWYTDEELKTEGLTHRGWLLFTPIYLAPDEVDGEVLVVERNGIPEFMLHAAGFASWVGAVVLNAMFNWPGSTDRSLILVTGVIR